MTFFFIVYSIYSWEIRVKSLIIASIRRCFLNVSKNINLQATGAFAFNSNNCIIISYGNSKVDSSPLSSKRADFEL